jgi:hypothetical protein
MASRCIFGVLGLLSTACSIGHAATARACLPYEPAVVTVRGTLERKTFPGPPNYESARKGDKPETYWILELPQAVCVAEDSREPDLDPARANISRIQLVLTPEMYAAYKALVGRKVMASGTLFGAISGHHHTPVLLTVRIVSASNP